MSENEVAKQILDAAFLVHTKLGPGLLESVYEVVLAHELRKKSLTVERQKPMPITYDGVRFDEAFRADLLVNFQRSSPNSNRWKPCPRFTQSRF